MKYSSLISILLIGLFITMQTNAQNTETKKHSIQWRGIDVWHTSQSSKKVLAFDKAKYIADDNDLPYFVETQKAIDALTYQAHLLHPEYTPLTPAEVALIGDGVVSDKPIVRTDKSYSKGECFLDISVLPIVKKEGEYLRLTNFELQLTSKTTPLKRQKALTTHTYANQSVLASGRFVKIAVTETGIHKISYEALQEMGIDPQKVRLFGYGGALLSQDFTKQKRDDLPEVSIWIEKGADGVFNAGDYILFYAQGVVDWEYDINRQFFTHTRNNYANEGYYFVTSDVGEGKRVTTKEVEIPTNATIYETTTFEDYLVHEKERINIGNTGKVFYGEEFDRVLSHDISFDIPNIVKSTPIRARIDVATSATQSSRFYTLLNGTQRKQLTVSPKENDHFSLGKSGSIIFSQTTTQDKLNYRISYDKPNSSARGYLNFFEINPHRELKMVGNAFYFRTSKNAGTDTYTRYKLSNTNNNTQIWEITDPNNIKKLIATHKEDTLTFVADNNKIREYVAINTSKLSQARQPKVIGNVPNQNIHGIAHIDYLIITHPKFIAQAEKLAQTHRDISKLNVAVVTTEQVYNEFSSGTPDASAYRWAAKMFYDRAIESGNSDKAIKYLLLFGRGSFDNRGLLRNSGDNLILTYQADHSLNLIASYVTDDYFGFLDNTEGLHIKSDRLDIGIGRFPVSNIQQAETVVNKTINYLKNERYGSWKNELTFLADDGDASLHVRQLDGIAKSLQRKKNDFQINKIYLDAYKMEPAAGGGSYPLAEATLSTALQKGMLMLNYMGHAGPLGFAHEKVLQTNDIIGLYNRNLPLWVAATCDFILFDVQNISAGEHVLLNPNGGGVALYSAARTVYASGNEQLNKFFTFNLFDNSSGKYPRLGDAVRYSKVAVGTDDNKLSYMLFGDPALKLNYPKDYHIVTEKINDLPVTGNEVFNALSVQKISGTIQDFDNNIATNFNGKVQVTIYDKIQKITTLNNHNDGSFTYDDRPNVLYTGEADVANGHFSFTFMVPRDIRYNFGTGRINYYASDAETKKEAQGSYEQFSVGGSSANYAEDTEGPLVKIYLNTPSFKAGEKVNETPLFVAEISDKVGINTAGSGIGHDLRLIIDEDPNTSYTLNHFFETAPNTYNEGSVKFKIPQLPDGKHTLRFHAWDLMNNSTTVSTHFEVVTGLEPTIFSVSNYPNPVQSATTFVISHNRPEVVLESTVDIYDLTGRHLYSATQNGTEEIQWDVKDSKGNDIQNGIYLYKISIKTKNSKLVSKANKIIVNRQ